MSEKIDIRKVSDNKATSYVVMTIRFNPDEYDKKTNENLKFAGFTNGPYFLHIVLTPGETYADYDEFRLAREKLPGNARWMVEKLQRIRDDMRLS